MYGSLDLVEEIHIVQSVGHCLVQMEFYSRWSTVHRKQLALSSLFFEKEWKSGDVL